MGRIVVRLQPSTFIPKQTIAKLQDFPLLLILFMIITPLARTTFKCCKTGFYARVVVNFVGLVVTGILVLQQS